MNSPDPKHPLLRRFNVALRREALAERKSLRYTEDVLKAYERLGEDPQYAGGQPISPALLAAVKGPPRTVPPAITPRPAAKPKTEPPTGSAIEALQKFGDLIRKSVRGYGASSTDPPETQAVASGEAEKRPPTRNGPESEPIPMAAASGEAEQPVRNPTPAAFTQSLEEVMRAKGWVP